MIFLEPFSVEKVKKTLHEFQKTVVGLPSCKALRFVYLIDWTAGVLVQFCLRETCGLCNVGSTYRAFQTGAGGTHSVFSLSF